MHVLMTPDELAFFDETLRSLGPTSRVTEWGSGGSTLLIADRMVDDQRLLSIEHSKRWYEAVKNNLTTIRASASTRVDLRYVPTEMPYVEGVDRDEGDAKTFNYSLPFEEIPACNHKYIDPERHLGANVFDSDLYFVDGISRGAVLSTIRHRARKKTAVVLLHDYQKRADWYEWAVGLYPKRKAGPDNILVLRMR